MLYPNRYSSWILSAVAVILIIALVFGLGRLFSLALLAGILLYYYDDKARHLIVFSLHDFFVKRIGLSQSVFDELKNNLSYFMGHYVLMGSVIYLLIGAVDYLFANLLYLPLFPAIWLLFFAVLGNLPGLSKGELYLGERLLKKSDFVFIISLVIVFCLLIAWYRLPFYASYFYGCVTGEIVWMGMLMLLYKWKLKDFPRHDTFVIWTIITLVLAGIWLWNILWGV